MQLIIQLEIEVTILYNITVIKYDMSHERMDKNSCKMQHTQIVTGWIEIY